MSEKRLDIPTEPIRILLTLTKEGTYESDVWVDGKFAGGGIVIGGFPAAYEQAQEVLWDYDKLEEK
jgi:hypothetical protein